jgi:hypothetical protein
LRINIIYVILSVNLIFEGGNICAVVQGVDMLNGIAEKGCFGAENILSLLNLTIDVTILNKTFKLILISEEFYV